MTLAVFAFAYTFDIANQAFSVAEDSINKPNRPIPSGKMSVGGAYARWLLSWLILPVAIYATAGPRAATQLIFWEVWTFGFYVWPKCDNWIARNTFTAVGAVTQLGLLDAVIVHATPWSNIRDSLEWLLFFWLLVTIHVQEFHDMEGDKISGRQTLPLLMDPRSRFWLRVATAVVIAVTVMVNITFINLTNNFEISCTLGLFHVASMSVLAVRLVMLRTKEADKVTYKYYYTLATYIMLLFCSHSGATTM